MLCGENGAVVTTDAQMVALLDAHTLAGRMFGAILGRLALGSLISGLALLTARRRMA